VARNHFAACALALVALSAACGGSDTADQEAAANLAAKAVRDSLRAARTTTAAAVAPATGDSLASTSADSIPAATTMAGATTSLAAVDSARIDSVAQGRETEVLRETFAYAGGTRDPFSSLVNVKNAGPELVDLQLVGIYQDLRTSGNSVAVVREKDSGKRHKLRVGDRIGRLRVAQIRSKDLVFQIEDFGFERQETLSLRKQEDVTP
jgi:hypothetical protein